MTTQKMQDWKSQLEEISRDYAAALKPLNADLLNTKPAPNSWSVAEVLLHLIKTNESYYPIIGQLKAGTYKVPALGRIGFLNNFFGNFILKAVEPTRKKKVKTFGVWEPAASTVDNNIVQHFEKHQQELWKTMESCAGLVDKGALISSPANKNIVYKLDKAFDILLEHERRHLNQVKEVVALVKNQVKA